MISNFDVNSKVDLSILYFQVMFGLTISSIWYWCSDQVIVQRALAAKSMVYAKGGCVFASYLKLLPLWIMVFPGMAARALFPNEVACANPDECFEICGSRYIMLFYDLFKKWYE